MKEKSNDDCSETCCFTRGGDKCRVKFREQDKIFVSDFQCPHCQEILFCDEIMCSNCDEFVWCADCQCVSRCVLPVPNTFLYVCETCYLQHIASTMQLQSVSDCVQEMVCRNGMHFEYVADMLENIAILITSIYNTSTKVGIMSALLAFYKTMVPGSILVKTDLMNMIQNLFQNDDDFHLQGFVDSVKSLREALDMYETAGKSELVSKFRRLCKLIIGVSLAEKMGLEPSLEILASLDAVRCKKKFNGKISFVHSLLDFVIFFCERGYQVLQTGCPMSIFHHNDDYTKWMGEVSRLQVEAQLLVTPQPHNIILPKFLSDLDITIEKGYELRMFFQKNDKFALIAVQKLITTLELIRADQMNKNFILENRPAPFGILISGRSSIGKTLFSEILFTQYGLKYGLPIEDKYKYAKNAFSKHWDGFESWMWCLLMDDVACRRVDKAPNGDSSLEENLQVMGNAPFTPPMAELAKKGKACVKTELVLATTNVPKLNACLYFNNEFAVLRRFQMHIELEPKPEFCQNGSLKIDENLKILDGDYPDFWIIKVRFFKRSGTMSDERAKFENECLQFDNIYDFLNYFNNQADNHKFYQSQAVRTTSTMRTIELCNLCKMPINHCRCDVQASGWDYEQVQFNFTMNLLDFYFRYIAHNLCFIFLGRIFPEMSMFFIPSKSLLSFVFFRTLFLHCIFSFLNLHIYSFAYIGFLLGYLFAAPKVLGKLRARYLTPNLGMRILNSFGRSVQQKYFNNDYYSNIIVLTLALGMVYCLSKIFRSDKQDSKSLQGESISKYTGVPNANSKERETIWTHDDYKITSYDVSRVSLSWDALTEDQVCDILARNCVCLVSRYTNGNVITTRPTRAICVCGDLYLCNSHGIPEGVDEIDVIANSSSPISLNQTFKINKEDIYRSSTSDLCVIQLKGMVPKKNIVNLFSKTKIYGTHSAFYVSRNREGVFEKLVVDRVERADANFVPQLNKSMDLWMGVPEVDTEFGFCGALLVSKGVKGVICLGIHMLGVTSQCGALCVEQQDLFDAFEQFHTIFDTSNLILSKMQCGRKLVTLHPKSPLRWVNDGVGSILGSFDGFRPKKRSKVKPTLICDFVEKSGIQIKYCPPPLTSWKPWARAVEDMVTAKDFFYQSDLSLYVDTFVSHIMKSLEMEKLEPYSLRVALNGFPGVAYVDSINRKTSAGFPWATSKQKFIIYDESDEIYQHPISLCEDMEQCVENILSVYHEGKLAHPVFTAHLKDEPITFKKAEIGKCRVFTGSPMDWGLVVRMFYLPLVRLMENNRILFMSAPGTNVYGRDWKDMFQYLTEFGDNRVFAGDYRAFDKSMSAKVILASFEILIQIAEKMGYSQENIDIMRLIAHDTAFPIVDLNGDLIQLVGTNPSGQPLTVIINCLTNVIYMMHVYNLSRGSVPMEKFFEHIHLMTYGDDNIGSVSEDCDFFNMCVIQKHLEDVGVEYTNADKSQIVEPFVTIQDASFLKRSFVEVGEFVLCPLAEDSIEKMLTICVKSDAISEKAQAAQVIMIANQEYFFYGRDVFENHHNFLQTVVREFNLIHYLVDDKLDSYTDLYDKYIKNQA